MNLYEAWLLVWRVSYLLSLSQGVQDEFLGVQVEGVPDALVGFVRHSVEALLLLLAESPPVIFSEHLQT